MEKINVKYLLAAFAFVAVFIWILVFTYPQPKLKVVACDVGQGDAILVTYKNNQVLIDGGPNSKVLECLSNHMVFWDRTIEMIVLTHPEHDHYTGLIDVLRRYKVENLLANNIDNQGKGYEVFRKAVEEENLDILYPQNVSAVKIGMMYFDILQPKDEEYEALVENKVDNTSKVLGKYTVNKSPNEYSIVLKLSLGQFDALLTGDIGPKQSKKIAQIFREDEKNGIEYIKIPHHGSSNGIEESLIKEVNPDIAVISVGEDNRYKHPNAGTLDLLGKYKIKIFRTDLMGDVVIESDGDTWKLVD